MTRNQIEYWKLQEDSRHNQVTESETGRHNITTERETERSNRARENIDIGNLSETNRHNVATERLTGINLAESERSHRAQEGLQQVDLNISSDRVAETKRHNIAEEGISASRAEADNALKQVQTQQAQIDRDWANIKNFQNAALTQKEYEEIEAKINQYDAQVDNLRNQMAHRNYDAVLDTFKLLQSEREDIFKILSRIPRG